MSSPEPAPLLLSLQAFQRRCASRFDPAEAAESDLKQSHASLVALRAEAEAAKARADRLAERRVAQDVAAAELAAEAVVRADAMIAATRQRAEASKAEVVALRKAAGEVPVERKPAERSDPARLMFKVRGFAEKVEALDAQLGAMEQQAVDRVSSQPGGGAAAAMPAPPGSPCSPGAYKYYAQKYIAKWNQENRQTRAMDEEMKRLDVY